MKMCYSLLVNLDKPITISASNRSMRRIRERLPIEDWRTNDFSR